MYISGGNPSCVKQELVPIAEGATYCQSAWFKIPDASPTNPLQVRLRFAYHVEPGGGLLYPAYDQWITTSDWVQVVDPTAYQPQDNHLDYWSARIYGAGYVDDASFAVPEPGSMAGLVTLLGLAGFAIRRRT